LSPATIQYGNLAEWVAAGVTFLFFGATWLTISRDHKEKRQQRAEDRVDQAQVVDVELVPIDGPTWPDGQAIPLLGVRVSNGSQRQVDSVKVSVWEKDDVSLGEVHFFDSIAAGDSKFKTLPWADGVLGISGLTGSFELSFVDIAGTRWTRKRDRTLVSARTSRKRHWYNPETEVTSPIPP
jgi:hypothetical protein